MEKRIEEVDLAKDDVKDDVIDSEENKTNMEGETKPNDTSSDEVTPDKVQTDDAPVDGGWVDIIGSGDLKKLVLKEGSGVDSRPRKGEIVTMRTNGQLEDGKIVDAHENFKFSVGEGDALQAWELCVPLMELGEICTLITTPRFAYGEVGRKPDIPPNATITYELELLTVEEAVNLTTLPLEGLCKLADEKRERGNDLFTRYDYSGAINSYTRALQILESDESADEDGFKQLQQSKIKCYNNLAAAQIKVKAYGPALKSCDWVLNHEKDNAKALFRKGKVLAVQGELTEALIVTKKALKLEPSNKTIHQELSRLLAKQTEQKEEQKLLCRKMVGDMANMAETTPPKSKMKNKYAILALLAGLLAVITAVLIQSSE
ncbi:peptidyl-prolyl cis-trans isomerase FKBP8-like [Antedon mediterranea]|uniref:peptidyl-prolyl cis-trans isomerase FKBP8-like n=1 Tax=Antedon mediterranea TaxID=105859 RepID=UPI003AF483D4